MIVPSLFHDPPSATGMPDTSVCVEPSSMLIRFSLVSAMKAMDRPSGDQKGVDARSVPGSGRAVSESSERSHNCGAPSALAEYTIFDPSGDNASDAFLVGGVLISSLSS